MILLHDYWRSCAAYRVRLALNLSGLQYESRPVNLRTAEDRAAENRARNPQVLVLTLKIAGILLARSLAIIEHRGETGRGGVPVCRCAPARPHARVGHAIAMDIAPVCNLSVRTRAAALSGRRFMPMTGSDQ